MKPGAFPVLVAHNSGKLYVRWFASRDLFRQNIAGAADNVVYQDNPALLLEVSLHDSAEAAQAECDHLKAQLAAMLNGPRGEA